VGTHATLREHLLEWKGSDLQRGAVAETVENLSLAGIEIAGIVALGPLAGEMAAGRGVHAGGDTQKELDFLTNRILTEALKRSPVAWMGSEEDDTAQALNADGLLAVNLDPLDGSSNIDTNVSIGTIFSILPARGESPLLQAGRMQLAAGYMIYGPQTAMVLSLGAGTDIFWLNPKTGEFVLGRPNVKIPSVTREYGVNSSNFRYWDASIKAYVIDCKLGKDGPRQADFNMRWVGSLVADAFRIFTRGGVYIYPGDARKGYGNGRLRLLYEANPIAMLVEQAGGACTTGTAPILDIKPDSLHQRVPLIFGSKSEVEEVAQYYAKPHLLGDSEPGLFRRAQG
jgi:fructose-1,6-bisphosphatase I